MSDFLVSAFQKKRENGVGHRATRNYRRGDVGTSRPAVLYRQYDRDGRLLYVGQTTRLKSRVTEHRIASCWFKDVRTISVQHFDSHLEALHAEAEAILTEGPVYNSIRATKPCGPNGRAIKTLGANGLFADLSKREMQIIGLYCQGKRGIAIAKELSLSPKSVSTYKTRIAQKMDLGFGTTVEIIARAIELGLWKAGT